VALIAESAANPAAIAVAEAGAAAQLGSAAELTEDAVAAAQIDFAR